MAEYTIDKIEYNSNVYKLQDNVSGYITGISSSDVTTALGYTPLSSSSTLDATKLSGTIPTSCYTNTNTTYTLTNALASHKFTWTFTAGGSGSGSTTTAAELVAGTGITLTDDTTNKKITIGCSVTNTDTKVTQAYSTSSSSYPLLMTATAGISSTASRGATTAILNNGIYVNPSTQTLYTNNFSAESIVFDSDTTDDLYTIIDTLGWTSDVVI